MLLKLLLLSTFLNCLAWIIIIPVWQYPDEQAHFAQVGNFAQTGSSVLYGHDTTLEVSLLESILGTARDKKGNNKYVYNSNYKIDYSESLYGYFEKELISLDKSEREILVKIESTKNPPLYYSLSSYFYRFFDDNNIFTKIYVLRVFSSLIFLLFILLSYKLAILIFKNQSIAYAFSMLLAFMPMHVFVSTGILPDVLTNLLFTITIYASIKLLENNFSKKDLAILASSFTLGLATRQQFLIAIPISLIILSKIMLAKPQRIVIFCTFVLSVAVLLFTTNFIKGPPQSPVSAFLIIPDGSIFLDINLSKSLITEHLTFTVGKLANETFAWYFGIYKWLSLSLPLAVYRVIKIFLLLSILGLFMSFVDSLRVKKMNRLQVLVLLFIISNIVYLAIFVIWDFFFRQKNSFSFGFQGRYFFPLIATQFSIFIYGMRSLVNTFADHFKKILLFITVAMVIIFNDYTLIYLINSYYDASSANEFLLQVSQYKPVFLKGNVNAIIMALAFTFQIFLLIRLAKFIIKDKDGY